MTDLTLAPSWYLIEEEEPRSGSFNMAADEWLLRQQNSGMVPTLRLYRWNRWTLSLGRNEKLDEEFDLDWCRQRNIVVLRRTTGGRAVLHGGDLTYSLIGCLQEPPFCGGPIETYELIAQGFYRFFEEISLKPQIQERKSSAPIESHVCFSAPAAYEILLQDRKVIGNAQRVITSGSYVPGQARSRSFLQHGSIPLQDQIPMLAGIFRNATAAQLRREMISLEATGCLSQFSQRELQDVLLEALSQSFGVQWQRRSWKEEELRGIARLQEEFQILEGAEAN
jgi:lipoate-protein ligase A